MRIENLFSKLDIEPSQTRVYDVTKHPKYISGEWTEEQVFLKFLASYDTPNQADGLVSQSYYIYLDTGFVKIENMIANCVAICGNSEF